MATMTVLDSSGATVTIEKPLAPGRAAAASSRPIALSSEDNATIGALTETAPATDTASSGLNGRLQRVAQRLTSLIALLPSALGRAAAASSLATVLSTEDSATIGALTETAPATDTASSGLNGRLQRVAQRLTTLLAVFPATIDTNSGNKSASTLRVVLATDQPALTNALLVSITNGPTATARLASAAASTNATNVKTTAGRVFQLCGKNNAAYDVFLVLYDAATNPPVPGTTTIRKKIVCPAGQAFVYDAPDSGLIFATGIGYAFTKLVADADTTALVAADVTAFNMDYS